MVAAHSNQEPESHLIWNEGYQILGGPGMGERKPSTESLWWGLHNVVTDGGRSVCYEGPQTES